MCSIPLVRLDRVVPDKIDNLEELETDRYRNIILPNALSKKNALILREDGHDAMDP